MNLPAGLPRTVSVAALAWAAACLGARGGTATRPAEDIRRALRRTPLVELFEKCSPAVVTVTTVWRERKASATRPGSASQPAAKPVTVTHVERGSGFVIHPSGFVLTNSHALKRSGRRKARFQDGKSYRLRVIGRDDTHDVALLKIEGAGPFPALPLGRSDDLMVGERAVVIGNPFGFGLTLGAGIVTGLGRSTKTDFTLLRKAIQTDAGVNPGVSGGPLLNRFGEVIGIATSRRDEADGIGFAVPVDTVRQAFAKLVAAEERQGFVLGMQVAGRDCAEVTAVAPGSPADRAGVQVGDRVERVGQFVVRSGVDFHLSLVGRREGDRLGVLLLRDGERLEPVVPLAAVSTQPATRPAGPGPTTRGKEDGS